jgi:nitrite reductase (NADH) small subunit
MLVEAAPLSTLKEGAIRILQIGDLEIGLALWRGNVYAIRNICPHMSAPVCEGYLISMSRGSIEHLGAIELDDSQPLVVCPWHGWEWQVSDGASITGTTPRVKTYATQIVEGKVWVELPARQRDSTRVKVAASQVRLDAT